MNNSDILSGDDIEVVLSAENNLYCAWQSLLAHHSCQKNLNITPLVVVHGEPHQALHRYFETLKEQGGRIQRVLNYRGVGTGNYAPRNTAASLLNVKTKAPYIMLCDTDFIFLNPIPRSALPTEENQITFDFMSYMGVSDDNIDYLIEPARKAGIDIEKLRLLKQAGGAVPHIIPSHLSRKLGADWLRCIECFATSRQPIFWIASMWGLVFAIERLGISWSMTKLAVTDSGRVKMFEIDGDDSPSILHYSYGNEHFNKRDYINSEVRLNSSVWDVKAPEGSISEFICDYLNAVKTDYEISYTLAERLQAYHSYHYIKQSIKKSLRPFKRFVNRLSR